MSGKSVITPEPEYLNTGQTAFKMGCSKRTIQVWQAKGFLPFYKIGRSVRFRIEDINEHLSAQCRLGRKTA